MRSVLITGVQGVGKSTVSRLAAQALSTQSWDYADIMLRVAPELENKDAISELPWERRRRIYDDVEARLAQYFMPGDGRSECILFENHLSILGDDGFRTFPHDDIQRYNPVALVVIEADPEHIIERRRADVRRKRHVGTVAEVVEQQETNRHEARLIGERFSLAVQHLNNTEPERSARELTAWLTEILS